jgi:hypothetical protein
VESLASISLPVFAAVGTDDHALLGQASSMIPILTHCKAGVLSRMGECLFEGLQRAPRRRRPRRAAL